MESSNINLEKSLQNLTLEGSSPKSSSNQNLGLSTTSSLQSLENNSSSATKRAKFINFFSKEQQELLRKICQRNPHISQLSLVHIIAYDFYQNIMQCNLLGTQEQVVVNFILSALRAEALALNAQNDFPLSKRFFLSFEECKKKLENLLKNLSDIQKLKQSKTVKQANASKIQTAKSHINLFCNILESPHKNTILLSCGRDYFPATNMSSKDLLPFLKSYVNYFTFLWKNSFVSESFGVYFEFSAVNKEIQKFDRKTKKTSLSHAHSSFLKMIWRFTQLLQKTSRDIQDAKKGLLTHDQFLERENIAKGTEVASNEFPSYLLNLSTGVRLLLIHSSVILDLFSDVFLKQNPSYIPTEKSCDLFFDSLAEYLNSSPIKNEQTHPISQEFYRDMQNLTKEITGLFPSSLKESFADESKVALDFIIALEKPIEHLPKIEQKISDWIIKYQEKVSQFLRKEFEMNPRKIEQELFSILMSAIPLFSILNHGDNIYHLGYLHQTGNRFFEKVFQLFNVFDSPNQPSHRDSSPAQDQEIEPAIEPIEQEQEIKEIPQKIEPITPPIEEPEGEEYIKIPKGIKARKLNQWLRDNLGFTKKRQRGSHQMLKNPQNLSVLFCPHSGKNTFKRGTLKSIERAANS